MANNQIDIKGLSDIELKALAYDLNILIGRSQQHLQMVIRELEGRHNIAQQQQEQLSSSLSTTS